MDWWTGKISYQIDKPVVTSLMTMALRGPVCLPRPVRRDMKSNLASLVPRYSMRQNHKDHKRLHILFMCPKTMRRLG